jgi:hypothetical protein
VSVVAPSITVLVDRRYGSAAGRASRVSNFKYRQALPTRPILKCQTTYFGATLKSRYSGSAGYDRLDIRPTWVTTNIFVLTYDQISSYDPRQRQLGEHISDITCSSLQALAVFALFCRRDHANSSYQSMYSINIYRVTEKGCVSLTARSSINQALRPAWRS